MAAKLRVVLTKFGDDGFSGVYPSGEKSGLILSYREWKRHAKDLGYGVSVPAWNAVKVANQRARRKAAVSEL